MVTKTKKATVIVKTHIKAMQMISMIHYFNIKLTDYQSKSKYCLWTIRLWLKPVHTDKYEKPYFGIDLDFEIL